MKKKINYNEELSPNFSKRQKKITRANKKLAKGPPNTISAL